MKKWLIYRFPRVWEWTVKIKVLSWWLKWENQIILFVNLWLEWKKKLNDCNGLFFNKLHIYDQSIGKNGGFMANAYAGADLNRLRFRINTDTNFFRDRFHPGWTKVCKHEQITSGTPLENLALHMNHSSTKYWKIQKLNDTFYYPLWDFVFYYLNVDLLPPLFASDFINKYCIVFYYFFHLLLVNC